MLALFAQLVPGVICMFAEIFDLLDLSEQKSVQCPLYLGIFVLSTFCMYVSIFSTIACETFYLSTLVDFIGQFGVH